MNECKKWREKQKVEIEELMSSIQEVFTPEDIAFNQKMVQIGKVYELQRQANKLLEEISDKMPFEERMSKRNRAYILQEEARKLQEKIDKGSENIEK